MAITSIAVVRAVTPSFSDNILTVVMSIMSTVKFYKFLIDDIIGRLKFTLVKNVDCESLLNVVV